MYPIPFPKTHLDLAYALLAALPASGILSVVQINRLTGFRRFINCFKYLRYDSCLNLLYLIALQKMLPVCRALGREGAA